MYRQTFTKDLRISANDFGFYTALSSNFLNVLVDIPEDYKKTITKFLIKVSYGINPIGFEGWFIGSFKFTQVINLSFNKIDKFAGLFFIQTDNTNPNVINFNNKKDNTVCFNPFTPETRPQTNNPAYPYLSASHEAVVDLTNANFLLGGDPENKMSMFDLLGSPLLVNITGYPDDLLNFGTGQLFTIDSSAITNIADVNMFYSASVLVEAS